MRMFITSKNKYLSNDMKIFGTCSIPLKFLSGLITFLQETSFRTDTIRIEQNCTPAESWCEIDAVQIKGRRYLVGVYLILKPAH